MEPRYWYGLDQWINPLGFGCWQLIGEYYKNNKPHGWGDIDRNQAVHLIHHALENGIQFFDTAAGYGDGKSETILGEALSSSSFDKEAVVCTKIPLTGNDIQSGQLEEDFKEKVETSLKRLKLDRIDVLLLHNPPDDLDWYNFDYSKLEDLIKQGKIGTYGVSARSLEGAENVINSNFGTCLEWVFNFLERRPIDRIFPKLSQKKMNFIGRSPLARGLIKSKYLQSDPEFAGNDFRSTLNQEWIKWVLGSIRNIGNTAEKLEDLSKLALRYCISYEGLSVFIPGFKKIDQLESALNAVEEGKLSEEFLQIIEDKSDKAFPGW
jgi:aryl-alcohol dehydrogenase-like predicted oxidoreductase